MELEDVVDLNPGDLVEIEWKVPHGDRKYIGIFLQLRNDQHHSLVDSPPWWRLHFLLWDSDQPQHRLHKAMPLDLIASINVLSRCE